MPNKLVCCARYSVEQSLCNPAILLCMLIVLATSCVCRQQAATIIRGSCSHLGTWPSPQQLPIVYHDAYNVSFLGIENLHVFDSKKFKKVVNGLEQKRLLSRKQVKPSLYQIQLCESAWYTQPPARIDISSNGLATTAHVWLE